MIKIRFPSSSGYTILELLIVITIIGSLFGLTSTMYYTNQKRVIFNNETNRLIAFIKKARNYALTSKSVEYLKDGILTTEVPSGGYLIKIDDTFEKTKITLFVDLWNEDDNQYINELEYIEISPSVFKKVFPDHKFTSNKDLEIDTFELHPNIALDDIKVDNNSFDKENQSIAINYLPPYGDTLIIDNSGNSYKTITINLRNNAENVASTGSYITKSFNINKVSGFPVLKR